MIYKQLEFHNVVELEERDGMTGLQLQRFPKDVRQCMSPRGRWNSQAAAGTEIRVVTDAPHARLFVSALQGDADLVVFRGECLHAIHYLKPGGMLCVHVSPPERLAMMRPEAFQSGRFAPNMWRFFLNGYFPMFHQFEAFGYDYRPPEPSEKPALRWLAYGSSITAGSGASRAHTNYVQLAARHLGVDVMNMGQGGACMCEKEVADFFAERGDWDFATLEVGVNMRDVFDADEFGKRVTYMVDRMLVEQPGKPVVLISPYTNFVDWQAKPSPVQDRQRAYEAILHELAVARKNEGLHVLEGRELLPDFTALNADLVHPGDYGNILMGENLARALRPIVSPKADD